MAEAIEEQSDCLAGKDGIGQEEVEFMGTGVFYSLLPYHCGNDGSGCHVLSVNAVLRLAHFNHAKQMGLASFASDIFDDFSAGEPTVHKEIVKAKMLNGSMAEHLLHAGYLVLEVLFLAFLDLGLRIAHFTESGINILLGKALRPGSHSSFLSQQGEINEHLRASVSTAEEESFMAEDASALFHMGVHASEHLAFTSALRHIGIVDNHTGGISGVAGVGAHGNAPCKFLVDIAEDMAPVNPIIGKNPVEHILLTFKKGLKRTAYIVRHILYGEEREENHHLDHLGAGELAVGSLFESHLLFSDVYGFKNSHYPLNAESATTFCEKIAQLKPIVYLCSC